MSTVVSEAELLSAVMRLAARYEVWAYHVPDSRGHLRGFPDLLLCGWNAAVFRELKTRYEQPTSEQRLVGYRLTSAGLDWAVWRPADLESGEVERTMRRIA